VSALGPTGLTQQQPKYLGTDFTGAFSSIPYGQEPLCLLTLPASSSALAGRSDVYTFGDLTQPIDDEAAAVLSGFLVGNNIPDDGILSGDPAVVGLVYVARIFLLAQSLQAPIFAGTGLSLSSPSSLSAPISAATSTVQTAQATSGVGNIGVGNSGGNNPAPALAPFDLTVVPGDATMAEFLDAASQTWAGPISMGGF